MRNSYQITERPVSEFIPLDEVPSRIRDTEERYSVDCKWPDFDLVPNVKVELHQRKQTNT
ncbi:MAG: hypothetical protein CMJ78_03185 [Planctomycetaceae bacterium]|nr:hypothetical protein [Planctomycetaceae bacterium]